MIAAFTLAACSPVTLEVTPAEGSARGGEALTLRGRRLPKDVEVFIDGQPAEVLERVSRRELVVESPPGLAGLVDVQALGRRGEGEPLVGGFLYLPLELEYARAPDHYLPTPAGTLAGAVAGDLDGDGLSEILLRDSQGAVSLWLGGGQGAFTEAEPPLAEASGGLAIARTGQGPALFVCADDARAARWLTPEGEALPNAPEAGPCVGARALDLDGDGVDELVELREGGVRVWRQGPEGLEHLSGLSPTDAEGCGDITAPEGLTADCQVAGGVATLSLSGQGVATWRLPLPALAQADAGFTLELDGPSPSLRVFDDVGVSFTLTPPAGTGPRSLRTLPVAQWSPSTEGAEPTLPLRWLELDATPSSAGTLALDAVLIELSENDRALIEGFERWPPDAELEGWARAAAATAEPPGLMLGGEAGLAYATLSAGALRPGAAPEVGCVVRDIAAADLEGDGLPELALACAPGQDRLLRGDGQGRWFDDSAAVMPLDEAEGVALAVADLDRDGLPELIVATRGGVDRLYLGRGDRWVDGSARLDLSVQDSVAALPLDVDGDHDLDLLLVDEAGARLYVLAGGR
ncbi:MAG: VCBS repeat-containing protein [Alphaproteobacteria bacterium]|nr:VCBS repeat-containing protein [Alphaproteobacteria bacterium]